MQGKTLYDRCRQTGKQALLDQWHPDRNSGLTPGQVTAGSHKKVWWRCKMGHEWQAEVRSRYLGTGCPLLRGEKSCTRGERSCHPEARAGRPVASHKKWGNNPGSGHPGQSQKSVVGVPKGAPVAGSGHGPERRGGLPGVRREGCDSGRRGLGHPISKAGLPSGTGRKTGRLLRIPSRLTATVRYGGAVKRGTPIRQRWPPEPTGGEAAPTAPERGCWPDLTT